MKTPSRSDLVPFLHAIALQTLRQEKAAAERFACAPYRGRWPYRTLWVAEVVVKPSQLSIQDVLSEALAGMGLRRLKMTDEGSDGLQLLRLAAYRLFVQTLIAVRANPIGTTINRHQPCNGATSHRPPGHVQQPLKQSPFLIRPFTPPCTTHLVTMTNTLAQAIHYPPSSNLAL